MDYLDQTGPTMLIDWIEKGHYFTSLRNEWGEECTCWEWYTGREPPYLILIKGDFGIIFQE